MSDVANAERRFACLIPSITDERYDNANKSQVSIPLFRQKRGMRHDGDVLVYWTPVFHPNGFIAYGERDEQRALNIESFCKFSRTRWNVLHLRVLDFRNDCDVNAEWAISNRKLPFFVNVSELSLSTVIDEIAAYRNGIRERTAFLRMVEMSNRRPSVFLLNVDDGQIEQLDEHHKDLLEDLMIHSQFERVYVIPMVSSSRLFPERIVRTIEWSAFLGEDNIDRARNEIFTNLSDGTFDVRRDIVGVLRQTGLDRFTVLHSIDRKRSRWVEDMKDVRRREAELYNEYLDTLDDGSIEEGH